MNTKIEIYNYNEKSKSIIFQKISQYIENTWLKEYQDHIQHIIDELIKNAIKSNYKLILIFLELKKIFKKNLSDIINNHEINEWLKEIIYSGESELIQQNLKKIDSLKISKFLSMLMYIENLYNRTKNKELKEGQPEKIKYIQFYLYIKKLLRHFNIYTLVEFYKNPNFIHILIHNGAPILEEDYLKIINKRKKFSQFVEMGKKNEFFFTNIDTSGGGHGLGYPLMDALLLDMNLKPEEHLYLISAKRTIVLLNLPLQVIPISKL